MMAKPAGKRKQITDGIDPGKGVLRMRPGIIEPPGTQRGLCVPYAWAARGRGDGLQMGNQRLATTHWSDNRARRRR